MVALNGAPSPFDKGKLFRQQFDDVPEHDGLGLRCRAITCGLGCLRQCQPPTASCPAGTEHHGIHHQTDRGPSSFHVDASYAKMERPRYTSKPPQSKARAAPRRSNRHKRIDLRECARRMAETIGAVHGSQGLKTSVTGDSVVLPAEHATNVCVAMNELITNAVKHGGLCKGDGQIKINIGLDGGRLHTTVWNSGRPIPKDFNSTELQAMGLRLVEGLVSGQYGGSFWLEPHEGGTLASFVLDVGALRETRDS